MKKLLALLLVGIMVLSLCACGSSTSSDKETKITTSSEAISRVKNQYPSGMFSIENRIANELGFRKYQNPVYGSQEAKENPDGSWTVTLKGNMSGYTDEYATNLQNKTFTIKATVTADGDVTLKIN